VTDDWRSDAACRDLDPKIWFPGRGADVRKAQAICATCPVSAPCLEFAVVNAEEFGIWGGLCERKRRNIRWSRGLRRPPGPVPTASHGTAAAYRRHLLNGESCDLCRKGNAERSAAGKARARQKRGVAV
jgi:WhiB family redox-sensing transcriptional regulator